jgi:hypothetical protein
MSEEALNAELEQEVVHPEDAPKEEVESQPTEEEGFSLEKLAEELEEKETPPEEEGKKKTAGKVQERIDKLTWEKWEAKREADQLRKELEEFRNTTTVAPAQRPIPPVEDDFDDPNEYRKARVKYEDEIFAWNETRRNTELEKQRLQESFQESLKAFNKRAERMRAKYPDFDEAISAPIFSPAVSQEVLDSEYGAEIGYYLAKNPDEALRLSSLPPSKVAKEIGKLEVKFTSVSKRTVSKAPPPINPLDGDDAVKPDLEKMPIEDFMKAEKNKIIEKRKRGFF